GFTKVVASLSGAVDYFENDLIISTGGSGGGGGGGSPAPMTVTFGFLQQKLGRFLFGRWAAITSGQLTVNSPFTADQITDINSCILEGLQMVYTPAPIEPGKPSHEWSFMRPTVSLTTQPPYVTGKVTVSN